MKIVQKVTFEAGFVFIGVNLTLDYNVMKTKAQYYTFL